MLVLGGFQLSVAGEYWPWFAVTAIFAAVPVVIGPRKHRLIGVGALTLSLLLIIGDYQAGKRFRAKLHLAPVDRSSLQTTEGRTLKGVLLRSAPVESAENRTAELARGASNYTHS